MTLKSRQLEDIEYVLDDGPEEKSSSPTDCDSTSDHVETIDLGSSTATTVPENNLTVNRPSLADRNAMYA